jgi:hypothetical protein
MPPRTTKARDAAPAQAIFLPTLLPAPGAEASPELCWELNQHPFKVALKYTQFGWSASVQRPGGSPIHWRADTLEDLRLETLGDGRAPPELAAALTGSWVLAYEIAGLPRAE